MRSDLAKTVVNLLIGASGSFVRGKGGAPRAFSLNDDMKAAIDAFIAADAWGHSDGSDYAKELYAAGWPKDVRPYQARHAVALVLGEREIDLGDVQGGSVTST